MPSSSCIQFLFLLLLSWYTQPWAATGYVVWNTRRLYGVKRAYECFLLTIAEVSGEENVEDLGVASEISVNTN